MLKIGVDPIEAMCVIQQVSMDGTTNFEIQKGLGWSFS